MKDRAVPKILPTKVGRSLWLLFIRPAAVTASSNPNSSAITKLEKQKKPTTMVTSKDIINIFLGDIIIN
jgi:hypothetical protein